MPTDPLTVTEHRLFGARHHANQPDRADHDGSYLLVDRGRRWTSILIDHIARRTEEQSDTAHRLGCAAALYVIAHGKREVRHGCGRTVWDVTVPTADAEDALASLFALQAGDHGPAEALTVRYTNQNGAPTE
jgi:hypothetical protein